MMQKIKVIEYISNLGDGGAETLVKDYVCLLDRNRFDPIVVVLRGGVDSANKRTIVEKRIPIIEIYGNWNIWIRLWNKIFGWWYIPNRLKRIVRAEKADVLHMHLMVLKHVSHMGKTLESLRLLFTCHSILSQVFGGERISERIAADKLIKNNQMQLVALHDDMAVELNEMFDIQNTVIIRNGIDFSRFRSVRISRAEKREELHIPEDAFVVGHVGRFSEQKNHMFLVEVFAEIAQKRNDAYLLMVGAGDTEATEQKLRDYGLANRYTILSHRADVNEIMRTMDVFLFPSLYEGLGIALIEAQVSGLRCIASNMVPEEAFRSENAIALPLDDPATWANVALDTTIKGEAHGTLEEYDMNMEIKRLEKLYLGEKLS